MALINRMSRLFTADVHAVLDRLEEPDVLLKHAIREMEEALLEGEQRLRTLEHERGALADRARTVAHVLEELGEQLDVCFGEGNDELARKVLKRRLETERLVGHVAERRTGVDAEIVRVRAAIDEQREQLDVMRQKAELLAVRPSGAEERAGLDFAVGEAEVEVAFLRERQKRRPS
jgi:phage shock protein A